MCTTDNTIHHSVTTNPFWPENRWWLALLAVLLCAGVLRYTGYGFGLPYIQDKNEVHSNLLARDIILTEKIDPKDTHAPYSLGLIGIHYALLNWFHLPQELPSTVLPAVRLISVSVSLLSVVLLGLLGYRLGGPQAGLAAASLWSILPASVHLSRTGAVDNFVTFSLLLGLFLVLWGTRCHRTKWILWSSVGVMLATLFSYQCALLIPLWLIIPLWRLRNIQADDRRAVIQNVSDLLFIFLLFLIWLLWLSPLIVSIKMGRWSEAFGALTLSALIRNFQVPLAGSAQGLAWFMGMAGLGWLSWRPFRRQVWLFGFAAIMICAVLWGVFVSAEYGSNSEYLTLISALFCVVCGIGLAGWFESLRRLIEHVGKVNLAWMNNIAMLVLVIIGTIPQIRTSIADAHQQTLHDRRTDLAVWADTTLEGGNHIADSTNDRVLNALFGGYSGLTMFPMIETAIVTDRPLDEWRSRDVMYAITPYRVYQNMQSTPEGQEYLEQMVLLKSYPPSPLYRDPAMVVFRLYPIQQSANTTLGPIHLIGYDLDQRQVAPGATLTIRYYWQATQPTETVYRVFNHLYSQESADPVAQIDGPPLVDLRRPTTLWNDPDETIVSQAFSLVIGPDVSPGRYRLVTGFYDPDTGQRLLTPDGEFVLVAIISVTGTVRAD